MTAKDEQRRETRFTTFALRHAGDADADAAAASRIVVRALNDLAAKQGRLPLSAPDDHAAPALRHVIATDGQRFWLAGDGDSPVAFGAGLVRGALAYCAGLFVLPEWQGRGLGRRLFEAALAELPAAGGVAALTSSAANPISNGLYARHGIYPQSALLYLTGPAAIAGSSPDRTGGLDVEPLTEGVVGELDEIDAAVLEADRTLDHLWFLTRPAHPGWLFRRRGRAVGYAYLGGDETEGVSIVGPVATLRAQDQTAALRCALGELAARGCERATVCVPGPNLTAQRMLWQAGFSFEGTAGLICASRRFGRLDRYVLAGDCLM